MGLGVVIASLLHEDKVAIVQVLVVLHVWGGGHGAGAGPPDGIYDRIGFGVFATAFENVDRELDGVAIRVGAIFKHFHVAKSIVLALGYLVGGFTGFLKIGLERICRLALGNSSN
jgi:hypothetical protein